MTAAAPTEAHPETNDADREFAAGWIALTPGHAASIRGGEWDAHPAVIATTEHRLSGKDA